MLKGLVLGSLGVGTESVMVATGVFEASFVMICNLGGEESAKLVAGITAVQVPLVSGPVTGLSFALSSPFNELVFGSTVPVTVISSFAESMFKGSVNFQTNVSPLMVCETV